MNENLANLLRDQAWVYAREKSDCPCMQAKIVRSLFMQRVPEDVLRVLRGDLVFSNASGNESCLEPPMISELEATYALAR